MFMTSLVCMSVCVCVFMCECARAYVRACVSMVMGLVSMVLFPIPESVSYV